MARGGKRTGAGRPKGSPNVRASIYHYFTEADIAEFFEFLKDNYKEDMRLMQWVGDHILGKPQQAIDHTTNGKELPQPILQALYEDKGTDKSV
jgi:hypothetical protein